MIWNGRLAFRSWGRLHDKRIHIVQVQKDPHCEYIIWHKLFTVKSWALTGWDALTVGRFFPVIDQSGIQVVRKIYIFLKNFWKCCSSKIFQIHNLSNSIAFVLIYCLNYRLLLLVCFDVFRSKARHSHAVQNCHIMNL